MVNNRSRKRGILITFEGLDGSGKSTQLRLSAEHLKTRGIEPVTLREPGTTPAGERIREILLRNGIPLHQVTELLLYQAARAELVAREIIPMLKKGKVVLCDRFYDSTTAYQGFGKEMDIGDVVTLNRIAASSLRPNLTLLYDLPPASIAARHHLQLALELDAQLKGRRALQNITDPDRSESRSDKFFQRVAAGFRRIAREEPDRVVMIDARSSISEVFEETRRALHRLLALE